MGVTYAEKKYRTPRDRLKEIVYVDPPLPPPTWVKGALTRKSTVGGKPGRVNIEYICM